MSLAKDNIWKLLAPLVVMGVMFLIPVPDGMPPQAWHYFAVFVAMIVGMILEPIPATAISFIAVTICVIGSNYLLFDAKELADPAFNAQKQALKWGLAGFSSTTVWLVFGAFIFALGYEVSGLGRRIALFLVKFMDKRTLTLGYAIVIIDILLAPFTPSNTARTGVTVFPVIKNLPPLFKSFPNDPSARRIGGYLMWMMVISTSLSSSMFVTGADQTCWVWSSSAKLPVSRLAGCSGSSASCRLGLSCLSLRRGFPTCCTNRKSHTVKKWQPGRVMN